MDAGLDGSLGIFLFHDFAADDVDNEGRTLLLVAVSSERLQVVAFCSRMWISMM